MTLSTKKTYRYKVTGSFSKYFPQGLEFDTKQKIHDGRRKQTELADKECNLFVITLIKK